MAAALRFYRDRFNAPDYASDDPRLRDLGSWLTTDIQSYAPDCLDLIAHVHDVRSGRSELEQWEGNAYHARFAPSGVTAAVAHLPGRGTWYPLDEAEAAFLAYLRFIAPTPVAVEQALREWEVEHGRTHPLRASR